MDEISRIAENHYIFAGRCNRENVHSQRLRCNIRVVFDSNGEGNPLTTFERDRIESTPEDTIEWFDFITIRVRFITRDSILVISALYLATVALLRGS